MIKNFVKKYIYCNEFPFFLFDYCVNVFILYIY